MTQHVRNSYRKHRKGTWAATLVVVVLAALALVLPALAIDNSPCTPNASTCVTPGSGQGVIPSVVDVGGSNFSCASSAGNTPPGMRQFQISKPTPGDYTDRATGVTFRVSAPTGTQDPKSFFSFSVIGGAAAVYHVGVNGGTKTAWYDYFNNAPTTPAFPNGGVFSDTNLHSTPDSKWTPDVPSFFVASITTFCFVPLTVTPSCTSPFSGIGFGGTGGTVVYSAQLVANGGCKSSNVVMYSYTPGTNQLFAVLSPATPGGTTYQVVEHISWTGITGDVQNPITLRYDDIAPYDGVDYPDVSGNDGWRVMKLCNNDPRPDPISSPFDLDGNTPVMPAGETTCMLQSTDSAGTAPSARVYDAWLFSTVDGARGGT